VHLTWQAYLSNYRDYADSRNPYVYAHPTPEVFTVVQKIQEYAGAQEDGRNLPIEVICPGDDYWPLPWYLRSFERVSWRNQVVDDANAAPLIIASPEVEGALTRKLYTLIPLEKRQMYLFLFDKPYYVWLRPGVKLSGFVRKDLWDNLQRQPAGTVQMQTAGKK
jgi:hypothetical protein